MDEVRNSGELSLKSRLTLFDKLKSACGFTLLELVIVIAIIITLTLVVAPLYNKTIDSSKEAVLKTDLAEMRKIIDRYTSDKAELPQSLQSLVEAGYLRELPVDPITGQADWTPVYGSDPSVSRNSQGITDIRSSSSETSSDGRPYSEW